MEPQHLRHAKHITHYGPVRLGKRRGFSMLRRVALAAALIAGAVVAIERGAPPANAASLVQVTGFGTNPGNLKMWKYVPDGLRPAGRSSSRMHGCTQTASSYDARAGWTKFADLWGFALRSAPAADGEQLQPLLQLVRGGRLHARPRRGALDQADGRQDEDRPRQRRDARLRHRAVGRRRDDVGDARRLSRCVRRRRGRWPASLTAAQRAAARASAA